jgi:hypothetical protein
MRVAFSSGVVAGQAAGVASWAAADHGTKPSHPMKIPTRTATESDT